MQNLLTKITLYDIISTTIPGFLTISCLFLLYPGDSNEMFEIIKNDFMCTFVIFILSYSCGWLISEFSKIFLKIINEKHIKRELIVCESILSLFMIIFKGKNYYLSLGVYVIISSIVIIISCIFDFNILNNKEYEDLKKLINNQLQKMANKELVFGESSTEISMKMSSYYILQTDPKYSRIHNFSSSKSYSKNISLVSLIVSLTFSYLFFKSEIFYFEVFYFTLSLVFLLAIFIFWHRYKMFEQKLNIMTSIYFLDYLTTKE